MDYFIDMSSSPRLALRMEANYSKHGNAYIGSLPPWAFHRYTRLQLAGDESCRVKETEPAYMSCHGRNLTNPLLFFRSAVTTKFSHHIHICLRCALENGPDPPRIWEWHGGKPAASDGNVGEPTPGGKGTLPAAQSE